MLITGWAEKVTGANEMRQGSWLWALVFGFWSLVFGLWSYTEPGGVSDRVKKRHRALKDEPGNYRTEEP
jgi:hypothetical protein